MFMLSMTEMGILYEFFSLFLMSAEKRKFEVVHTIIIRVYVPYKSHLDRVHITVPMQASFSFFSVAAIGGNLWFSQGVPK